MNEHTTPVLVNGRWMMRHLDFRAVRYLEHPQWEPSMVSSMAANLRPGDVLVDVGCESGDMSALYAMWGVEVVLVEPNPRAWPNVRAVWEANNLAPPLAWSTAYLGDRLVGSPTTGRDGWPDETSGPIDPEHGTAGIPRLGDAVTTIDDLLHRLAIDPQAITIDVEGAELDVLHGARRTLDGLRPIVWLSIHPAALRERGQCPGDVLAFADEIGYRADLLGTDHEEHWLWRPR